jgi:3-deoxy-7-phosphoheptulonate synthase
MVIVIKPGTTDEAILKVKKEMEAQGFTIHESRGANFCVLGVVGDTAAFDVRNLMVKDCVEKVLRVQEPYKRANRLFHPADSVIDVSGVKIGGNKVQVIAGPCSVESEAQITAVAEAVKKSGATLMRGGAFKPRTSPYSFQGLREEGLDLLQIAKKKDRPAHRHRDYERPDDRALRGRRGPDPGGRPQHAEL